MAFLRQGIYPKTMLKKLTLIGVLAILLSGLLPAVGQTQTGLPQGYSVAPYFEDGRSDDIIVQLNNLTIQGLGGNIIYASQNYDVRCLEYPVSSSNASISMPCPVLPPRTLYQIQTSFDTIILQSNRTRMSFGGLAIGDRINVYGFLDRDSNFIQALIVRDLDKPYNTSGSGYIQINGARVLNEPNSSFPPASFLIGSQGGSCISFASGYARTISCPPGMSAAAVPGVMSAEAWPFSGTVYDVKVSPATQILAANRTPYPLSGIHAGHIVNVYGRFINGAFEALIIRDLSSGSGGGTIPPVLGKAQLTVEVIDRTVVCITAPCGLVDNVVVQIQKIGGVGYVGVTSAGRVTFRELDPGTYTVRIYQSGKPTQEQNIGLGAGDSRTVTMSVSGWMGGGGGGGTGQVYVSSIAPGGGYPGTTVTLIGSGFSQSNTIRMESGSAKATVNGIYSTGNSLTFQVPENADWSCPNNYFCTMMLRRLDPGTYQVWVENQSGVSNRVSFVLYSSSYFIPQ